MKGSPATPLPLGARVRRALVDAPDDALLLTEGERLAIRLAQRASLVLESGCHALNAAGSSCSLEVTLDGARVPCPSGGATALSAASPRVITKCSVEVPAGRHRIEALLPPDREAIAWTRVTDAGGRALDASVTSEWIEIDPARPLELSFAGPTVVRVQARSGAGEARNLRWSIAQKTPAPAPQQGEILTEPAADPIATRPGARNEPPQRVTLPAERRVAVTTPGPHLLRVESPGGRALLRVDFAIATGLPRARAIAAPPPPPPKLPAPSAAALREPDRPGPPVGEDPPEGLFTLGAYGVVSEGDIADEDTSQSLAVAELGAHANRELVENRAWAGLRGFTRLRREGSPTFGGDFAIDFSPDGLIPGGFGRGRAVVQTSSDKPTAVGLRGTAGIFWSLPLFHSLALVPSGSFTLRRVDASLVGEPSPDRDIYTRYGETHPRYATLGARLNARPFVDGLARLGASVRSGPTFSDFDRVDAELEIDILAGRGFWPWIGLSWLTSYRPVTAQRPLAFVRDVATLSATFWRWIPHGHRITIGSEASYIFDLPAVDSLGDPSFAVAVFFQYDHTGNRGLRDLPPHKRPFQDRLEEDEPSGRIQRQREGYEWAWEAPR
jgi:hypothetical protein